MNKLLLLLLQVFSLSNPAAPASAGVVSVGYATQGAAVAGSVLYLSDGTNNSLRVLSLASPAAPAAVGSVAAASAPNGLAVAGGYRYAAEYYVNKVETFSLASPTAPVSQGTVAAAYAGGVAVLNSRLYVGDGFDHQLLTYNVAATPAAPAPLGSQALPGGFAALAGLGNFLYATDDHAVQVLRVGTDNVLGFDASGNLASVPATALGDNLGGGVARSAVNLNGNKLLGGTSAAPSADGLQVDGSGRVGIGLGAGSPTEQLQVAGNVKITGTAGVNGLIFPDNTMQTTAASGTGFIRNQATPQTGAGKLRLGTATTPATVYGQPTGTAHMLALAYGQQGSSTYTTYATSGNYSGVRNSAGSYTTTFPASSGLSTTNLDNSAVVATLYGPTPGFVTQVGGTGTTTFYTFGTNGAAADRIFTFSLFTP